MQSVILKAVSDNKHMPEITKHQNTDMSLQRVQTIDNAISILLDQLSQNGTANSNAAFALLLDYVDDLEKLTQSEHGHLTTAPLDIMTTATMTLPVNGLNRRSSLS
jgi:hypothetical protein